MESLLIIDDDVELCRMLRDYLVPEGYRVENAHQAADGLQKAKSGSYELVILDVMLPEANGFDVLRSLRATSNVPVLMLTARGEEIDRIAGLEAGADDYLSKPFNPRELAARIRSVLRRARNPSPTSGPDHPVRILRVGDLKMDTGARSVRRNEHEISLTGAEFDLLRVLLDSAGQVVSREDIFRRAMGRRPDPLDRSIDVHVSSLRRKLGARQSGAERIRTVRGVGYLYIRPGEIS